MRLIFKDQEPSRLDLYLSNRLKIYSRSYLSKVINQGNVKVNSKIEKPGYKLQPGDKITLNETALKAPKIPKIKLDVVYEDSNVIVINKPSGLLTHAKGNFLNEATIETFIKKRLDKSLEGNRAGIVHRLDRGTSGLIIAAKNPQALLYLQKQFASRKVVKKYLAVISGDLDKPEALINMPIERNPKHPSTFRVGVNGKKALTKYRLIKTNGEFSLIELIPETGRTHQLRVHLAAIGHPILGDDIYGGNPADRLMLHAAELTIRLPDLGRQSFKVEAPPEFYALLR